MWNTVNFRVCDFINKIIIGIIRLMKFKELNLTNNPKIVTELPGKLAKKFLETQKDIESSNVSYPHHFPLVPKIARGSIIEDVDGNQFIDFFAGCGVLNIGHNNPRVIQSLLKYLDSDGIIQGLDFPTEAREKYAEKILSYFNVKFGGEWVINFGSPTGSDAVEAAIKLARINTKRNGMGSFQGGYHGMTTGALAVTSKMSHKRQMTNLPSQVVFLPYCSDYRCPLCEKGGKGECLKYIKNLFDNSHSGIEKPAAIIIEPVQGEGGTYSPPEGWLKSLVDICHERDILVIFDEIQSGFYRTGTLCSFENSGAIPDIVTLSKGFGGIGIPFSAIVYRKELNTWNKGTHIGTFRGNQLSFVAGLEALNYIEENDVSKHVVDMGDFILKELSLMKEKSSIIGDVRGVGMMFGIEMVKNKVDKTPFPECIDILARKMFERGLLVESGGYHNNVIRLIPPLTISTELVVKALGIFKEIIGDFEEKLNKNEIVNNPISLVV